MQAKMTENEKVMTPTVESGGDNELGTGSVHDIDKIPQERGDEYAGAASGENKGQLRRSFKTRHVQMIALGANIGSGVYVSIGKVWSYSNLQSP